MLTLYPQHLGAVFPQLPAVQQRLHSQPNLRWQGVSQVTWSRHWLVRCALWLAGLPRPAALVVCQVTLQQQNNSELWQRQFAGKNMRSRQFAQGNALFEQMGLLRLQLVSTLKQHSLWQCSNGAFLWKLPLPRSLSPHVFAREWVAAEQLCFDVRLVLPWFGVVLRYRGQLQEAVKP